MRPGFKAQSKRIGDPCINLGCAGTFREVTPEERTEYIAEHPFAMRVNQRLRVAECDACGLDVIGLAPEEAPENT